MPTVGHDGANGATGKLSVVIKAPLSFSPSCGAGPESTGEGKAQLLTDRLMILPAFWEVLPFPYRSVEEFGGTDKVHLSFVKGRPPVLSNQGLRYEDLDL